MEQDFVSDLTSVEAVNFAHTEVGTRGRLRRRIAYALDVLTVR
jgi:hypothetical protein